MGMACCYSFMVASTYLFYSNVVTFFFLVLFISTLIEIINTNIKKRMGKYLFITEPRFYVFFPRMIIQGTLTGIGDYATYSLTRKISNENAGEIALILILTNWFQFYCGVRAYSNSFEASLTIIILAFFWPLTTSSNENESRRNMTIALFLASISIIVRPTSFITWIYFGLLHYVCTISN